MNAAVTRTTHAEITGVFMSRSPESAGWCTRVVIAGLLASGSLAAGAATAIAEPDPLAPVTYTDTKPG